MRILIFLYNYCIIKTISPDKKLRDEIGAFEQQIGQVTMVGLRERLEDYVYEAELAQRRTQGDEYIQMLIASTVPLLVEQMQDMDLSEVPTYKRRRLMPLGKAHGIAHADNVECTRMVYLGEDGKFYIEGPRRRMTGWVIDVHPYSAEDAKGWGGISASEISDLLTTYVI